MAGLLFNSKKDAGLAHHSLHSPWRGHTQRVFPSDDTGMKAQNSATRLLFLDDDKRFHIFSPPKFRSTLV